MSRPPLDAEQVAKVIAAYHETRERAVRYALGVLDPSASNAPALPYLEVLTRMQEALAWEMARYAAWAEEPSEGGEAQVEEERAND
jgi:hypothetical protein